MTKYHLNAEEQVVADKADVFFGTAKRLRLEANEHEKQGDKYHKEVINSARIRILAELKAKIKTLPRKKKNGDRMTYSIDRRAGYIGSSFEYNVPFIITKVYKKTNKKDNEDIVKAIARMADKIGYKVVEK